MKVNGHSIAAGTPNVRPHQILSGLQTRVAAAGMAARPLGRLEAELRGIIRDGLATANDKDRLANADAKSKVVATNISRLESQLLGTAPWFLAPHLDLPAPSPDKMIRSARVTVTTFSHEAADSLNYVYLTAGGPKYLIGSPARPLTSTAGRQRIDLDLDAGPLAADRIGARALGMMARSDPQGEVPDRWHPQRFIVELDGQVAYDSDRNDRDRESLAVIRIVPPVQIDWSGSPRSVRHSPREVSLWTAGGGAGLEPNGKPLPLPGTADPSAPKPESGAASADTIANRFPGEGPAIIADEPPTGGGPAPGDSTDPAPAGSPVQIRGVRFSGGQRLDDRFVVRWNVAGDESRVDHYEVQLIKLNPKNPAPGSSKQAVEDDRYLVSNRVPPGMRMAVGTPAGLTDAIFDPTFTVRPLVRAVTRDPAVPAPQMFGPARAVFPRAGWLRPQPRLAALMWRGQKDDAPEDLPVKPGAPGVIAIGRPAGPGCAAWPVGAVTCNGVTYSDDGLGADVALQMGSPADRASIWFRSLVLPSTARPRDLIANVGFADDTTGQVDVRMSWYPTPPGSKRGRRRPLAND